jgi:hypothetical protein
MKRHSSLFSVGSVGACDRHQLCLGPNGMFKGARLGTPDYPTIPFYNPGSWGYYGSPNYNYAD